MSRKRYSPEKIIGMLREAELDKVILKDALEGNY
jgi:hypothetical protein